MGSKQKNPFLKGKIFFFVFPVAQPFILAANLQQLLANKFDTNVKGFLKSGTPIFVQKPLTK